MRFVYEEFRAYYSELQNEDKNDSSLKYELVGRFHHFLVNCITKIRAFNLTPSLVE